jgi:ATP-dependent exoDNAse (exonuclease V) beta subunit
MRISDEQRRAIECTDNAIVAAGAGSGKTTVLARRFVELIRTGRAEVDGILTLTFTRKAAAEMHRRIYTLLSAEREDPRIAAALDRFKDAQISTIDSFCTQIVRGGTHLFGIQPNYSLDPPALQKLAERKGLDFLLEHQADPALRRFIETNGFETVWKSMLPGLAEGYFSLAGIKDLPGIAERQRESLETLLEEAVEKLDGYLARIADLDPEKLKTVADLQHKIGLLPDLGDLLVEGRNDPGKLEELRRHGETLKYTRPRAQVTKFAGAFLREVKDDYERYRTRITDIPPLLAEWESTEELFRLFHRFQLDYLEEKRRFGAVNFTDVQEMALEVLKRYPEVRAYYKGRFRYIMIDEFQDNNLLQKRLLYYLAEREDSTAEAPGTGDLSPDKLFFVGDEKQSIYLFRGADVSVFKGLKDELAGAGGRFLELATNYRSDPGLITFFNRLFEGVMRNEGEPFEADFTPLDPRPAASGESGGPEIGILVKEKNGAEEPEEPLLDNDDAEAYHIAKLIREAVESGSLTIPKEGGARRAEYSDFAILLRSSSNQVKYERMLRRRGIPYRTENVRTLFLEAPVNDIYTVLRLAVYPEDRFAYAGLLRSPFVNISDPGITEILLTEDAPFETEVSLLSEDDRDKYLAGSEMYRWVREWADRIPLASLIAELWYRFGYRYLLLSRSSYHGYLEYFDYLYRLAESADEQGDPLAAFLAFLEENLGKFEKLEELDVLTERSEGVKIMTVHKSKGLEFPVVIVANAGNRGRSGETLPYHISPEYGLTLKTGDGYARSNYFYSLSAEERKRKELAELKRLLYVACTRAEAHLYITGCRDFSRNVKEEGSFLDLIYSAFPEEELRDLVTLLEDVTEKEALRSTVRGRSLPPGKAKRSYTQARELTFPTRKTVFNASETEGEAAGGTPSQDRGVQAPALPSDRYLDTAKRIRSFGDLVHFVLEQRIRGTYSRNIIPSRLLSRFPVASRDAVTADAETLAGVFLDSDLGSLAGEAGRIEPEFDFLVSHDTSGGRVLINGRADLFFESGETAYVVDYKTDRLRRPEEHANQLELYARALGSFTDKPVRCFLFYLRFADAVEIPLTGIFRLPVTG